MQSRSDSGRLPVGMGRGGDTVSLIHRLSKRGRERETEINGWVYE